MSVIINIIVIAIFTIFIAKMSKNFRAFSIVIFLTVFFSYWLVISVAYIETGVYIIDFLSETDFIYSTVRLVFYELIFYGTCWILGSCNRIKSYHLRIRPRNISTNTQKTVNNIILIVNLLLLFNSFISGNVLTNSSVTRFNFYTEYSKINFVNYLAYNINAMGCLGGINFVYGKTKRIKNLSLINFFLSLFYLYLVGNQFGYLFYLILYFFMPFLIYLLNKDIKANPLKSKKGKKVVLVFFIFSLLVVGVKLNSFKTDSSFSKVADTSIDAFLYRALALQGDTWYGTDKLVFNGFTNREHINSELKAFFDTSYQKEAGIQYLMKLILPEERYNRYIWGNAELMSGYPAINIVTFGYFIAIPIIIIEAAFFYLIASYAYKKIINKQYFRIFLAIVVLEQEKKVVGIGGMWWLANLIPAVSLLMIMALELWTKYINKKYYLGLRGDRRNENSSSGNRLCRVSNRSMSGRA